MSAVSNEDHPEVQAARITARATRQVGRLAAVTALLGVCIGGTCMVTNTAVQTALPVLLQRGRVEEPPRDHFPKLELSPDGHLFAMHYPDGTTQVCPCRGTSRVG